LQATEINKLQLIIAIIRRLLLADCIHFDIIHFYPQYV